MVETISPVVHGGRNRNYWSAVALHTLGATVSASLLGVVLGAGGWLLGAPWGTAGLIGLAAVSVLYAARELLDLPIPLPDLDRQVPDWWRTYFSRNVAAFLYGAGLGVGFLTYLSFGTLAAVATATFISGSPATGALVMAAFGIARGASVVVTANRSPKDVVEALGTPPIRRRARLVNGLILVAIAAATLL
ncbi:MAG: sulfite exporter TauE/SafE family protein [Actinomycetota bacterium]